MDKESEHQVDTHKERKHEQRVSTWRKRNENHKDKKEEDQKWKFEQGYFLFTRNTKKEKRSGEKKNLFSKNVQKQSVFRLSDFAIFWLCQQKKDKGNEICCGKTKETTYFVERCRNVRKMAKTKEVITILEKQGDTQKEKEKKTKNKRPNKRNERSNDEKRSKRRR